MGDHFFYENGSVSEPILGGGAAGRKSVSVSPFLGVAGGRDQEQSAGQKPSRIG